MYDIGYNFTIDDHVWIADGTSAVECIVTQVTLEVDPSTTEALIELTTYHLRPLTTYYQIILKPRDEVFATLDEVVAFISDPEATAPQLNTHIIYYNYTIDETVWVLSGYAVLESQVIQVTFDIDPDGSGGSIERTLYHVLPISVDFSTLIREEIDVYPTKQAAVDHLKSTYTTPTVTPTTTITPTPTVTPTPSAP